MPMPLCQFQLPQLHLQTPTTPAAQPQGFAAGQEGGLVTLFERDDREKEGFRRARAFTVHDHPLRVRCDTG